jgi:hypothetical protein
MGTTSKMGIPYPENTDFVADGATAMKNISDQVDLKSGLIKVIPTGATNGTVASNGDVTIGNAVTSVTVTGAFSATFTNYKIIVSGGAGSTTGDLTLKMGATATGYYYNLIYMSYTSGTINGIGSTTAVLWPFAGAYTANSLHANIDLFQPFATKRTTFTAGHPYSTTTTGFYFGGGNLENNTSYTDFTLGVGAGHTLTGGIIKVYGYN